MKQSDQLQRRTFLTGTALVGLGLLGGCGGSGGLLPPGGSTRTLAPQVAYRLSTRGRRSSNAAELNAANKRFRTLAAAEAGRAHAGDTARVVPITVSGPTWQLWFGAGNDVVDLRHL